MVSFFFLASEKRLGLRVHRCNDKTRVHKLTMNTKGDIHEYSECVDSTHSQTHRWRTVEVKTTVHVA